MELHLIVIPADFYSRPCGRGDLNMSYHIHVGCISTHAPAGGATFRLTDDQAKKLISTHAPAGGATGLDLAAEWAGFTFLLTPLREGRPTILPLASRI